jgi:uncharacterized protein (DUF1697 family)
MPTYIALLRGINVSGQKPVPMAELKTLFEKLGFKGAKTLIQTGNVVFSSPKAGKDAIVKILEAGILKHFSFDVSVILRTLGEMEAALAKNPYGKRKLAENEKVYISFLARAPDKADVKAFEAVSDEKDEFIVTQSEVYILVRDGYGKSRFSNNFVEKKLKVAATTRNLETTGKLIAMGGEPP